MAKLINSLVNRMAPLRLEPELWAAHREHLLERTKSSLWVCILLMPPTALPYFYLAHRDYFLLSLFVILTAEVACFLELWALKRGWFDRHANVAVFILVGVILNLCATAQSYPAPEARGIFLFGHLLVMLGAAVYMPTGIFSMTVSLATMPLTFFAVSVWQGISLVSEAFLADFTYLVIGSALALVANQILMAHFLSDKRNQLRLQTEKDRLLQITSQLAHDLQSPLASINACIRICKDIQIPQKDFLMILELSAKRLHSIANEVLNQRASEQIRVFSLHKILDELIGEYGSANTTVLFHKIYGEAISLAGDRGRIQRCFGNIIKNALEAMSAMNGKGRIEIRTSTDGAYSVTEIADFGPGMNAEKLAKVLKGGFTEGKKDGHGIGMQVVSEVVEEHKGKLEAESAVGRGTVFRIRFPLPSSTVLKISSQVEEGAGLFVINAKHGDPIVVIDDDPAAQLQWQLILRKEGLEPLTYESFEDFEKKASLRPPLKSAIVDYHYDNSELTGFQVIEHLQKQGFDNITLCTGEYWKPSVQKKAKEMSVPVCPKPIPKIVLKAN